MSGKAKSKASKDKAKNQTGQLAQTMSNGGQGVAMQCNPSGWVDSINANNACGQSGGIQQPQPQFMNSQGCTQQYYYQNLNQTFPSGTMQNQNINMGTNIQSQGQGKGQIGQHTQSNTVQYDQSDNYCGPQQSFPVNNNAIDSSTIVNMIQQLNNNFMGRLSNIEVSVSKLTTIEYEISHMRADMTKLQLENSSMSRRMVEVEKSCQTISNMIDDAAISRLELQNDVSSLKSENAKLRSDICTNVSTFEERCSTLNSNIEELKARSMQSNLVFYGIAEAPQGETDNTESKLRDFLKHELELERPEKIDEIVFDRVHRLGRPRWNQHISSRPIVAKFERYKDREFVRHNSKTLNEKRNQYNIREQFPPEMEAKRKILYSVMRSYSRDPNNRVALVRDKLFINGELYNPPNSSGGSDIQSRGTQNDRDYSDGGPGNRRRARGV